MLTEAQRHAGVPKALDLELELEARPVVSKVPAISTPSLLSSGEPEAQFPHL